MRVLPVAVTILASLLIEVGARSVPASHVLHEERQDDASRAWVKRSLIEQDIYIPVQFALTQTNIDKGSEMLLDISHPASPNYGKHLSQAGIGQLFAPSQDSIDAVTSWIKDTMPGKKVQLSPSRQWLWINVTIAELQDFLHADYHEYEHSITGKRAIGCEKYHVPRHINEHLDFIIPGVSTLQIQKRGDNSRATAGRASRPQPKTSSDSHLLRRSSSNDTSNCGAAITPACIRAIYNITDNLQGNPKNSFATYQSLEEYYNQTDLNNYFKMYAPEIPSGTSPEMVFIDGAPPQNYTAFGVGQEATLDTEAAFPLVYPDKMITYQVFNGAYYGVYNTFLDALDKSYCNYSAFGETGDLKGVDPPYPESGYEHPEQCGAYTPAHVISISYSIDENSTPVNYQRRQCNEWMKLGLSGVTVAVASGDSGVGTETACSSTLFGVYAPSNCPWITSVGGTGLPSVVVPGQTPQTVATDFPPSGGFSNVFPTPEYQKSAVDIYFQDSPPPYPYYNIAYNATHTNGTYNRGGRGIPDVSAIAQTFPIFYYGYEVQVTGTSLSAPLFAGMIARINSFRLDAGKGPVGFINPVLYANPQVLQDVVTGSNPSCDTNGFSAVKGWDPVSGLGTPNYGKMKDLFMSLP